MIQETLLDDEAVLSANPITAVLVEGLHGTLDYQINLAAEELLSVAGDRREFFAASEDRLTLLYGANGVGKTTILRMLFDALSSAGNRGHRNALRRLAFRRLLIRFSNGTLVEYKRREASTGALKASVKGPETEVEWDWDPDEAEPRVDPQSGEVRRTRRSQNELAFLAALERLGVNPVFLTDSRVLTSDAVSPEPDPATRYMYAAATPSAAYVDDLVRRERNQDLREALERVHDYLRREVLNGTRVGAERADTVYASVTETVATAPAARGRPPVSTIPDLLARVSGIEARINGFTDYGLLAPIPTRRLIDALDSAEDRNGRLLHQVLTPYLDGLDERMDGLEAGRRAIAGYVDTVNSFFEGKRLEFSPSRGALILDTATGGDLEPDQLSSGEKQILVLFSDVVALRARTSLFIIDEPELSLNPSWQRKLMPAFLASTEGTAMQLISATHSVEIMAKYRQRLVPLTLRSS